MKSIFRTPAALLEEWRRFCDGIVRDGYTAAPTDTAFVRAVAAQHACREATVAAAYERHAPAVQDAIDRIRADILTQGALAGKYPATVSTFVLKNKCGWVDKPDRAAPVPADIAAVAAQIERIMQSSREWRQPFSGSGGSDQDAHTRRAATIERIMQDETE